MEPPAASITADNNEEKEICVICLCTFKTNKTVTCLLPCSHVFCANCITMHIKTNSSCPLCRASLKTITICKYENDQFDRNQIDPATVAIRLKYEKQMYICTHVAASSSYEELMTLICDLLYLSADHVKLIHKNKKLNPSTYSPSMLVPPRSKKNTKTEKDAGKLPLFLLVGLHAGKQKHRGGYDSDDSVSAESYCVTC